MIDARQPGHSSVRGPQPIPRSLVGNRKGQWVQATAALILAREPGSDRWLVQIREKLMITETSGPTRRNVLVGSAAAGAVSLLPPGAIAADETDERMAIRPFS